MTRSLIDGSILVEGIDQTTADSINAYIISDYPEANITITESEAGEGIYEIRSIDQDWNHVARVKDAIRAAVGQVTAEKGRAIPELISPRYGVTSSMISVTGEDGTPLNPNYREFVINKDGELEYLIASQVVLSEGNLYSDSDTWDDYEDEYDDVDDDFFSSLIA